MESSLSKSIGLGILVTLVTNISGVSSGRAAIIGANVMLLVRAYIWISDWIKSVNKKLDDLSKSTNTDNPPINNTNTTNQNNEINNGTNFMFVLPGISDTSNAALQKLVQSNPNNLQPVNEKIVSKDGDKNV